MPKYSSLLLAALLGCASASAQVYPEALPTNRSATGAYTLRNIALGEARFANEQLYNLYDQGGSPMGLLETQQERAGLAFAILGSSRAAAGDSLALRHQDTYLPQLRFSQAGVFAANLYYQRESESARLRGTDSVEFGASLFGLDLTAGPSSGLFRLGIGAHARLGRMEHSGNAERVLVEVPSVRLDLGSRPHPSVEVGVFAAFSGRFDSLESPDGNLQRYAEMTLPKYGVLADFGGLPDFPLLGNVVLEMGTQRLFGEEFQNGLGTVYPITWTKYWTLQTQWTYAFQVRDFRLAPAFRFSRLSKTMEGYEGIKGNQDPFKKGDKDTTLDGERGVTAFGLGGNVGFRDWISLLAEWETSGMGLDVDSLEEERYHRFSLGLEHRVDHLPSSPLPQGISLALRAGWTWRQEEAYRPGYRDYHFTPFMFSATGTNRAGPLYLPPDKPAAYSAFHLGFGAGVLNERLGLEGILSFPGQAESPDESNRDATGTEFGLEAHFRFL